MKSSMLFTTIRLISRNDRKDKLFNSDLWNSRALWCFFDQFKRPRLILFLKRSREYKSTHFCCHWFIIWQSNPKAQTRNKRKTPACYLRKYSCLLLFPTFPLKNKSPFFSLCMGVCLPLPLCLSLSVSFSPTHMHIHTSQQQKQHFMRFPFSLHKQ